MDVEAEARPDEGDVDEVDGVPGIRFEVVVEGVAEGEGRDDGEEDGQREDEEYEE